MSVNDDILNGVISHAVYTEQYKAGVVKQMLDTLAEANEQLFNMLVDRLVVSGLTGDLTIARIQAQINAINAERTRNLLALTGDLTEELSQFLAYETGFTVDLLANSIPVNLDYITPPPAQVFSAAMAMPFNGVLLSEALTRFSDNDALLIQSTIRAGYLNGLTTQQIIRELVGTKTKHYLDGLISSTARQITALTRTALQHFAMVAAEQVYAANSNVIKGLEYTATLDTRTTPICRARDGDIWRIDDPQRPRIPAHWQCRSRWVPVTKSWRELGIDADDIDEGTRASMDGQVPASIDYEQWLRNQNTARQEESFKGSFKNWREKYALWLKGDFTFDSFVNIRTGHEYTLDELRKRDSAAFNKVGI